MVILITQTTQYQCDKYDLHWQKITLCTLEQNIHVNNVSAKLVQFYMNVQDKSAIIVRKVSSGNMKKISIKTVYSHSTYVNYKQPTKKSCIITSKKYIECHN
jgi:hypothetical protein